MQFNISLHLFAQDTPVCGWTPPSSSQNEENLSQGASCPYDFDEIISNCIPIYVRVKFHFFVNDDCSGNVQITRFDGQPAISQAKAYKVAEDLINQTNVSFANNDRQWTVQGSTPVCNPIRYVLSGVEMHCKSNAIGGYSTGLLHDQYGGGILGSEIDVYVADFPPDEFGNATGIGITNGGYASIDWIDRGNFSHEIGHVLNLGHSFGFDACEDTPVITYNWDRNCDGDLNDPNEMYQQCWTYIGNRPLEDADGNKNSVHDCFEITPCTNSPCCSWSNVDNNLMSYNENKSAVTSCQVEIMLKDLIEEKCDLIAGVGSCPPPVATITQTAFSQNNTTFGTKCLVLSASFNDVKHRLHLFKMVGSQETPVSTPGWISGAARDFCFSTACPSASGVVPVNRLEPNTTYRAKLWVQNTCGEVDMAVYDFTTSGSTCTGGDVRTEMSISPNPGDGAITVSFDGIADEKYQLRATHTLTGQTTVLTNDYTAVDGSNVLPVSVNGLVSGTYVMTLLGDAHLYQNYFVKF